MIRLLEYKYLTIGHVFSAWIRSIMPSSAMDAHEESWNAYPTTKTRWGRRRRRRRGGSQVLDAHDGQGQHRGRDGLLQRCGRPAEHIQPQGRRAEESNRRRDGLRGGPDLIGRLPQGGGPEAVPEQEDGPRAPHRRLGPGVRPTRSVSSLPVQIPFPGKPIMCAYKLCRVEFRYWGLQVVLSSAGRQ